ncbi:MAG: DegT/DnrJ/EryC1/StrS family aminotransferase [Solirubrobacterales bacterium]
MPSELPELNTILHSGALAFGNHGKRFEQKLSSYVGAEYLTLVNSFNSAVLVTLLTLGVNSEDEVIASPMACLASNQPIMTIGAKVVWADIDPTTGTLDPQSVRQKITSKTKAIFHNHFCGYPGYIDEINSIGNEFGIPVVDDAIEAFGSEYKGKIVGCTGTDVTMYSFQAVRLPTTIDGGAVVFKSKELYEKSLLVRDSGINRKYFRDNLGEINSECDITVPGFGATMSELNSYIGFEQMKYVGALVEKQRDNARSWTEWLHENFPHYKELNNRKETNPNFWVYGILADNKVKAINKFRDLGYYASGVHLPNTYYTVFGKRESLLGVNEFHSRFVAIPSGWWVEQIWSRKMEITESQNHDLNLNNKNIAANFVEKL